MHPDTADVLRDFSPDRFFSSYLARKPVVIPEKISHWPASRRWSPKYLMRQYGDVSVVMALYDPQSPSTFLHQTLDDTHRIMKLRDFLADIESGDARYAVREDTAFFERMPQLFDDLDNFLPFAGHAAVADGRYKSLWVGPAQYVTGLHVDPGDTFLFQIYGRKHVVLFGPDEASFLYEEDRELRRRKFKDSSLQSRLNPRDFAVLQDQVGWSCVQPFNPDLSRFPLFSRAHCIEAYIGPGDTLYIPDKWWHAVRALDVSISVSMEPEFDGPLFTRDDRHGR
jgi:lysine-specific demethylase 8